MTKKGWLFDAICEKISGVISGIVIDSINNRFMKNDVKLKGRGITVNPESCRRKKAMSRVVAHAS